MARFPVSKLNSFPLAHPAHHAFTTRTGGGALTAHRVSCPEATRPQIMATALGYEALFQDCVLAGRAPFILSHKS